MKRIILTLCAIGAIIVLWSSAWLFVASQISTAIASAAIPIEPNAPTLTCGQTAVTGFPFRFDASCADAQLVNGDTIVTLPGIHASILVYRPTHILASFKGPAHISDAFYGTEQELRWDGLQASLRTNGWQLARLSIEATNLAHYDTLLGDTLVAKSSQAELHLLDIPEKHDAAKGLASLALYLSTSSTNLPMLTIADGQLRAEAEITNLPDDLRNFGLANAIQLWQQAGGKLLLTDVQAEDSISSLALSGDLQINPQGEVTGQIAGISQQVAERFADFIQPDLQSLVFGVQQPDGSYKQTITMVQGAAFVGMVPIGAIPKLF